MLMNWINLVLVYFFGLVVAEQNGKRYIEPVPVNWVIGQFFQSLLFTCLLGFGLIERFVLKHFFYDSYCNLVIRRLNNWDTAWLERKIREKLDEYKFKAPNYLHEMDVADNETPFDFQTVDPKEKEENRSGYYFGGAAKNRVRSMKQLCYMFLTNSSSKSVSIPGYPDLGYELLILDTAMWRWVCISIFKYNLNHVPYFDRSGLTEYVNDDMLSDRHISAQLELIL